MLIDSHAHLDDKRFDNDRDEIINEITASSVTNIINIGADMPSSRKTIELTEKYPFIYGAVGVHPHDTKSMTEADIQELKLMLDQSKIVAIGEIGLDYFYDNSDRDVQRYWFTRQLELANELDMPVVIHDRDAHEDCMEILRAFYKSPLIRGEINKQMSANGVMHCYSGSADMAHELLDMGFYISFTGVITFKNARRAIEALQVVPMDRLLIETDCPYLSPEPYRGERNHCGYVKYVAQKIAEIKELTFEEVAEITAQNTKRLFRF